MYVRDIDGNEFPIMATHKVTDDLEGNIVLSADLYPNKANLEVLDNLTEFWQLVTDDETVFKIVYCKAKGEGNSQFKTIKAIPKAFDDLNSKRVYERHDGTIAVDELIRIAFFETGYSYRFLDSWDSIEIEGYGDGDTCLDMFKYVLKRIGAEFYFTGNSFTIQEKIGSETEIMYRHRLNASNIVHEVDGQEYYTYAKGYGNYRNDNEGWQNAKLIREYTSPVADLIKQKREAPPIKNANITKKSTMDEALKKLVDNSIKISVTADLVDLRSQNYPYAQSNLGDTVFLIDERINFNETVRVVKRDITYNWRGDIINLNFTFGSQNMVDRYRSKTTGAIGQLVDILAGRKKMPFEAMAHEIQILTGLMLNVQTQFEVAENGSILAIDKKNPNNVVIYNANGLFVSTDGGQTPKAAITARGIMGEAIIAYSITADKLEANAITVGFNNQSENIKLFGDRIDLMSNNKLRARLNHKTLEFYNEKQQSIGKIDAVFGGVLLSTNRRGFVGLGQDSNGSYSYNILVDPNGVHLGDGKSRISLTGVEYIDISGHKEVTINGYDASDAMRVGHAFKGERLLIPTTIGSDGTVSSWMVYQF